MVPTMAILKVQGEECPGRRESRQVSKRSIQSKVSVASDGQSVPAAPFVPLGRHAPAGTIHLDSCKGRSSDTWKTKSGLVDILFKLPLLFSVFNITVGMGSGFPRKSLLHSFIVVTFSFVFFFIDLTTQ